MTWTEEAWKEVEHIYADILKLDFVVELGTGELSKDRFVRYMQQDKLYLRDYAKALDMIADRAPSAEYVSLFRKFSKGSMEAEQTLHNFYLETCGSELDVSKLTKNIVCEKYTSTLLNCVEKNGVEVGAAAILPCFWIYDLVGIHHREVLAKLGNKSTNPYAKWIELYSSADFTEGTLQVREFTDKLAEKASPEIRREMTDAFIRSTVLEFLFWKIAYTNDEKSLVQEYGANLDKVY